MRHIIRNGIEAANSGIVPIHLKDIETEEGDPTPLKRRVQIVRNVLNRCA